MSDFQKKSDEVLSMFMHPNGDASFRIYHGKDNIMLSAPHSVEQTREGQIKPGEYQTGVLAVLLNDSLKCPAIVKTNNNSDDANFDAVCSYKSYVVTYVRENGIKLLLDLHMLSSRRPQMINIGTGKGNNTHGRNDVTMLIKEAFEQRDFGAVVLDEPFAALFEHTVSATIARECSIPCFQIEINSRIVVSSFPEYRFEDLYDTLRNLIISLREVV
jgi:hypothetical protein